PPKPAPKTERDLVLNMSCKVCLEQLSDTAFSPCNHLATCQWCADELMKGKWCKDKLGHVTCPVCRGRVVKTVKIYT
ncbi:hypothetical protein BDY21DRAFT_269983, partial [Lineolata rhizophorae]